MVSPITYPHDPTPSETPTPPDARCETCDEPWPCAKRRTQRETIREATDYLRSDLYEPVSSPGEPGKRWRSPIGWEVWMTYGIETVPMAIRRPDGEEWAATTAGDVGWLEEVLP